MVSVDDTKLAGLVHVDGAHAGGKVRKANKKADRQKRQQRDKIPDVVTQLHPNRRILMVGRSVEPGVGGVRSVVASVRSETASNVLPFVRKHVEKGSKLHTDKPNCARSEARVGERAVAWHARAPCVEGELFQPSQWESVSILSVT